MKQYKIYGVLFLMCFYYQTLNASLRYSSNCKEAYLNLFLLKTKTASRYIEMEKMQNPDNKWVCYTDNLLNFILLTSNFNFPDAEEFVLSTRENLNMIENQADSEWKLYMLSELHLELAVVNILSNEYLKAILNFYRANSYIQKNYIKYPAFIFNYKIIGFFNLVFSLVPDDFVWIMKLMKLEGNMENGINQLKKYSHFARNNELYKPEGMLIEFLLYNYFQRESIKVEDYIMQHEKEIREIALYRFFVTWTLVNKGYSKKLESFIDSNYLKVETDIVYNDYIKGLYYLYNNKVQTINFFQKFLNGNKGNLLQNTARGKLCLYYKLNGDAKSYQATRDEIISNSQNTLEVDRQAYKEAINNETSDFELTKARIYFDAGEYQQSIDILLKYNSAHQETHKIGIEYFYRLARAYQLNNNTHEAIKYFNKVSAFDDETNNYFRGFSYYNLAIIYAEMGNEEKAIEYINYCLSHSDNTYNYSLEIKTKIATYKFGLI